MRILNSWNTRLIILLFFLLILLNYFNLIPISKTFPFLSFLPHIRDSQFTTTTVTPFPTPLPPITVKKVDTVKGEGEFVINNPTPQVGKLSLEKQIVLNGIYDTTNKKITIQTSVQDSYRPLHSHHLSIDNSSTTILLKVDMIVNNKPVYQTFTSLNPEGANTISFSVELPFYNSFLIKISNESNEVSFSQEITL